MPRSQWQHPPDLRGVPETLAPEPESPSAPSDDRWRPLAQRGRLQAEALRRQLAPKRPQRILSGPARRCRETVQPLAEALGLQVEIDPRLDEDTSDVERIAAIESLGEVAAVVCTHGATIASVLDLLEIETDEGSPASTRKGAYWELFGPGMGPLRARYVEPQTRSRRAAPKTPRRGAVLDLGSTSFHMLVAEWTPEKGLRKITRHKSMLRLGASVAGGKAICQDSIDRALDAVRELRELADREKVEWILPVGTAALRDAPNGRRVAQQISETLDAPVRILSGQEEARVIFRAFRQRLDLGDQSLIALDLGGGSLELASGHGRHVHREVTLPLGAVRLTEEIAAGDPMSEDDIERLRDRVITELRPEVDGLLRPGPERPRAVAAGGTARALGELIAARDGKRSDLPFDVSVDELEALAEELARASHDERLGMPGMRRRRADILPAGALVITTTARELGVESITLCDWGMREGILLESLADLPHG